MPADHEVYAHAPLVLVTAQVSFSYEPALNDVDLLDQFAQRVRERLPILASEPSSGQQMTIAFGPAGAVPPQIQQLPPQVRASNDAYTVSATLNSNALTIEATEYLHFEGFAEVLGHCLRALESVIGEVRVARAGLRYIDEVRPLELDTTAEWQGWVADQLLAPIGLLPKLTPVGINGVVGFEIEDSSHLVFRWGEQQGATIVSPFVRRDPPPPTGRFMVLDADAFWMPPTPEVVGTSDLIDRFTALHGPLSEVFEASLTERVRDVFRGDEGA